MNYLHARTKGWYDDHANAVGKQKCVFCDLRDKYIITELGNLVLTVNLFPYTEGHLMVIPRRHFEKIDQMKEEELKNCRKLMILAKKIVNQELGLKSFWLLLREGPKAGKTVRHLHWQVMPYHEGMVNWHYDFRPATIEPIDLAQRLRARL